MEKSNYKQLIKEIIKLSENNEWNKAKLEWSLDKVFFEESHCLCGHYIEENCTLLNKLNGNKCIVGNVCVNKFMEMDSKSLFVGHKRILKDRNKSTSKKLLEFCYNKKVISQWEYEFYCNIFNKKKLTPKQKDKKKIINGKIILYIGYNRK